MNETNVYLLVGFPPTFLKQEMEKIIKEKDFLDAMTTQYDLEEVSLNEVLEDVDTLSFLTPKKVVIAKHCAFLEASVKKAEENKETMLKHLEKYIENPSSEVLLFLSANKLDERKKIVKKLREKVNVREMATTPKAIMKQCLKSYEIEKEAEQLLLEYCQDDQERLWQECEKLAAYKLTAKKITKEDVVTLVTKNAPDRDALAFSLTRDIALKNKAEALQTYRELAIYGLEPYAFLGLLESQYRLLYQVMVLEKGRHSKDQIAKTLGVHPFRVTKTLELTRYYSLKEVSAFLKELAHIDLSIKTGKIESDHCIEMLILNNI